MINNLNQSAHQKNTCCRYALLLMMLCCFVPALSQDKVASTWDRKILLAHDDAHYYMYSIKKSHIEHIHNWIDSVSYQKLSLKDGTIAEQVLLRTSKRTETYDSSSLDDTIINRLNVDSLLSANKLHYIFPDNRGLVEGQLSFNHKGLNLVMEGTNGTQSEVILPLSKVRKHIDWIDELVKQEVLDGKDLLPHLIGLYQTRSYYFIVIQMGDNSGIRDLRQGILPLSLEDLGNAISGLASRLR
ncbi:MAG: hypothetical protein AAFX87_07970 [Bacteroidota bacterium]